MSGKTTALRTECASKASGEKITFTFTNIGDINFNSLMLETVGSDDCWGVIDEKGLEYKFDNWKNIRTKKDKWLKHDWLILEKRTINSSLFSVLPFGLKETFCTHIYFWALIKRDTNIFTLVLIDLFIISVEQRDVHCRADLHYCAQYRFTCFSCKNNWRDGYWLSVKWHLLAQPARFICDLRSTGIPLAFLTVKSQQYWSLTTGLDEDTG